MKDKIQKQLDEAIQAELDGMSNTLMPSEKEKAIANVTELYKLRIEEARLEQARIDKLTEQDSKEAQLKGQKLDRWLNVGLQVGLTVGGWLMFSMWQRREMKFELEGTPTTPMFRHILSQMTPKLKKYGESKREDRVFTRSFRFVRREKYILLYGNLILERSLTNVRTEIPERRVSVCRWYGGIYHWHLCLTWAWRCWQVCDQPSRRRRVRNRRECRKRKL